MDSSSGQLPWRQITATAIVLYFACLATYRLFFHPLSRFPGPTLAALTRWYEAYYDVVRNGRYMFKIADLHREYGPIVRISPHELHINDADFFNQLYSQEGRWHKYDWAYDAFLTPGAAVLTVDHDVHKARRQPLNPFFSKAKVALRQDMMDRNTNKLCDRIQQFARANSMFNLGAAITAFTRDVATEFILNKTYNSLDQEDFHWGMTTIGRSSGAIWRITKHARWFGLAVMSIPKSLLAKIADDGTRSFFHYMEEMDQDTERLMEAAAHGKEPRTIVHGIMDSDLPPSEKVFSRLTREVSTVTGAGFETSASVLRLIFFHVFSNAEILGRLRAELAGLPRQSASDIAELKDLEKLPYLTAVLMEGLRLSPGVATRLARISPDRDLSYKEWRIPAGTPVSMTVLLMHLDEKIYPDPLRFNPDRWMDPDDRRRLERTFAPFQKGTRSCLGLNLAWAEMYIVLSALVRRFDFEFVGAEARDFECECDHFLIGTRSRSVLNTYATALDN